MSPFSDGAVKYDCLLLSLLLHGNISQHIILKGKFFVRVNLCCFIHKVKKKLLGKKSIYKTVLKKSKSSTLLSVNLKPNFS